MIRKLRLAASVSLLSFVGLWLGHTIEYVRVWGSAGLRQELTGSVHGYMVLLALVLGLLAGAGGVGLWTMWSRLGHRVDRARRGLADAWRGRQVAVDPSEPDGVSWGTRLAGLWVLLTGLQIGLYLVQENVEQVAAGHPAAGIAPVTGTHWAAPLVHAAVALVLATAVALIARAFRQRITTATSVEGMIRALLAFRRRPTEITPPPGQWRPAPLQSHGSQLWCRPPPLPRAA